MVIIIVGDMVVDMVKVITNFGSSHAAVQRVPLMQAFGAGTSSIMYRRKMKVSTKAYPRGAPTRNVDRSRSPIRCQSNTMSIRSQDRYNSFSPRSSAADEAHQTGKGNTICALEVTTHVKALGVFCLQCLLQYH